MVTLERRFSLLCSGARLQACENAGSKPRATQLKNALTFASWNRLAVWLRQLDSLRPAA
jgi:hypothetical protein